MLAHLVTREDRAERDQARHGFGVGPAADALQRGRFTGLGLVYLGQLADQLAFGRDVERRVVVHLRFVKAAEGKGARHAGIDFVIGLGDRVADGEGERERLIRKGRNAEVDRQVAGELVAHGKAERLAARLHADALGKKGHTVGQLALERELRERLRQTADRVLTLLGRGAVRGYALRLHADAALDRGDRDLVRGDPTRGFRRTGKLRGRAGGGDVAGRAALEARQAVGAALVQAAGKGAV